jgi:hypothetical protein
VAATVVQAEKAPSTMSQISELLQQQKEGTNILHLIILMGIAIWPSHTRSLDFCNANCNGSLLGWCSI